MRSGRPTVAPWCTRTSGATTAETIGEFAAPTTRDFRAFLAAMDAVAPDTKVFVHCAANMRVSAFMSLYGRQRLSWSAARAAEHLAEVWQPDETWRRFLDEQVAAMPRST